MRTRRRSGHGRSPDPELIEMKLKRVASIGNRLEAHTARVRRSTVMPGQRWRNHLVARDEIRKQRPPVAPMACEPVQQNHRLALPGAVQRR